MTSRWDALKPSTSERKHGRGGRRHQETRDSRASVSDNSRNTHPGRRRNRAEIGKSQDPKFATDTPNSNVVETSTSWRKPSQNQQSRNNPYDNQVESNAPIASGPKSTAWDELTTKLWKLGEDNSEKDPKQGALNWKESLSILNQLSDILSNTAKASFRRNNISPAQRGKALASALNLLRSIDRNQQEFITGVLEWSCNLLRESPAKDGIQLTTTQAQTCVQGLVQAKVFLNKDLGVEHNSIMGLHGQCFSNIIISFAGLLPAEETAHQVVGGMLLPALESIMKSPVVKLENPTAIQHVIVHLQALHTLLKEKKHASALLAPLVNDVAADGQEEYLINPIRRQLFQILQLGLQTATRVPELAESIYECLTLALQMATAVDKSTSLAQEPNSKHAGKTASKKELTIDVDVTAVEMLLKDTLSEATKENTRTRMLVFKLLLAFLKKRPEASLSLGKTLLFAENPTRDSPSFQSRHSQSSCPNCKNYGIHSPYSPYLDHLHNESDIKESDAMVECLVLLIQSIPWTLWMGRNQPQFRQHRGMGSSFSHRITDSILSLINVARCRLVSRIAHPLSNSFHNRQGGSVDPLPRLIKAILLEIPYSDSIDQGDDPVILEAARGLFETLARSDLLLNERQPPQFLDSMVEVFGECLGGRETPEGLVTEMIAPANAWLSSDLSRAFLDDLVCQIMGSIRDPGKKGDDRLSLAKAAAKLYRFVLRARPGTVLDDKGDWAKFQSIIEDLCRQENKQLQVTGLQLLESLLRGRSDDVHSRASAQEECVSFVLSLLPQMTKTTHGPCRIICFEAYGSLSGADWMSKGQQGKGRNLKFHAVLILAHCTQVSPMDRKENTNSRSTGEPVAAVRAAACKAIGDICSNCFLASDGESDRCHWREESLNATSHDFCQVLSHAIKDGNASVRSMAIFAMGNLAQVLCEASSNCLLSPESVQCACLAVHNCVDDSNDKAVSNALRSLGHLGTLILRKDYVRALDERTWNRTAFLCSAINSLSGKVDAILAAVPGRSKSTLSWKQRSATKKHGRVACNSLAFIFPHLTPDSLGSKTLETCLTSVHSLVHCIECLGTQLDSKVLVAAMLALQALSSSSLSRVSGKSGAVGHAMVACILFLAPRWEESFRASVDRVTLQVESLLDHLLDSASTQDAAVVLACDEIADSWMDPLYQWMVVKGCKARAFDNFALALQKPGLNVPISVEHRFSNRALNLLRNARQSPLDHLEPTADDDEL